MLGDLFHEDSFILSLKTIVCKMINNYGRRLNARIAKCLFPNVIDGVTGSVSTVNMWRSHYNGLFNCIKKYNNIDHDLYNNVCYEPAIEVSH